MPWIALTILGYFFLSIVSLFDRYFLVGSIPNPRVYTFYVGALWFFLGLFLIPFGVIPSNLAPVILLGLAAGFVRNFAILYLIKSIAGGEVSRVVPAIGGFLPIFSFLLFLFISPAQEILNPVQIMAFFSLILGSVLISFKRASLTPFSFGSLKYPILAAFLFAINYFLNKLVFLKASFVVGGFWTLLGGGLGAASLLLCSETRRLVFSRKAGSKIPKMSKLFFLGQVFGGLGIGFLYYAIFLARSSQVPLINALEGTRFVFLLLFVFLLSLKWPHLLKEEMSGATFFQKILAIILIGGGLAILAVA